MLSYQVNYQYITIDTIIYNEDFWLSIDSN